MSISSIQSFMNWTTSGRTRTTKQRRITFFEEMEALYTKYPERTRKSKHVNIMLEIDEEERNEYVYKTNNKYQNDTLNEMD